MISVQSVTCFREGRTCFFVVVVLLAPTGALILMMVRDISVAVPAFSDFEHLCLSILLQVSL